MEVSIYCSKCGEKTPHTLHKPAGDDDTIYFVCGKCFDDKKYLYKFETREGKPQDKGTYNKKEIVIHNGRLDVVGLFKNFFR